MTSSKSSQIKRGIHKGYASGKSKVANRMCYGYKRNEKGELMVDMEQAKIVRWVFEAYVSGATSGLIAKELEKHEVPNFTGQRTWNRNTIDQMLVNEKYVGNVLLQKFIINHGIRGLNKGEETQYLIHGHHESILTPELWQAAQKERARRSNVSTTHDGCVRKSSRY